MNASPLGPGTRQPDATTRRLEPDQLAMLRAAIDVLAVLLAFGAGSWLYAGAAGVSTDAVRVSLLALVFAAICLLVFWHAGLYRPRASVLNLWELEVTLRASFVSSAMLLSLLFLTDIFRLPKVMVLVCCVVAIAVLVLQRRLVASLIRARQLRGSLGRRVLILGCGQVGRLLFKKIVEAPHVGRTVVGFLDDETPVGTRIECSLDQTTGSKVIRSVLGSSGDVHRLAGSLGVEELLIDESAIDADRLRELLKLADSMELSVGVVPGLPDERSDQLYLEDLSAIPVLRPLDRPLSATGGIAKRVLDLAGAAVLLILSLPAWPVAAALIKLGSPGPVFFVQDRIGLHGRRFKVLKFRTMWVDTDPYEDSPTGLRDGRITSFGRVLRVTGLDELPQLINVLLGEMSLVGPRPEMPYIVRDYTRLERRRLEAKPGITGIWQLSPDRRAQIHDNIEYDLYYLNHRSFVMDLVILGETVWRMGEVFILATIRLAKPDSLRIRHVGQEPSPVAGGEDGPLGGGGRPELAAQAPYLGSFPPVVLVALDQRRTNGSPASWKLGIGTVSRMARRWPVKVLAAESNRDEMAALLEGGDGGSEDRRRHVRFASAANLGELRSLASSSQIVITDVPRISELAFELGRDVVSLQADGLQVTVRSDIGREVVDELMDSLPPVPPEPPHGGAGLEDGEVLQ